MLATNNVNEYSYGKDKNTQSYIPDPSEEIKNFNSSHDIFWLSNV